MTCGSHFSLAADNLKRRVLILAAPIALAMVLAGAPQAGAQAKIMIDPATPLEELLPDPPEPVAPLPFWRITDLRQTPEVFFQRVTRSLPEGFSMLSKSDKERMLAGQQDKARKEIAAGLDKIRLANQEGRDQFVKALIDSRPDLEGLPFLLGDACRLSDKDSRAQMLEVSAVREAKRLESRSKKDRDFWAGYKAPDAKTSVPAVRVATLLQMFAEHDSAAGQALPRQLSAIPSPEATRALARLAVFSFEPNVRSAALKELAPRGREATTEVLLAGLRYPWPEIALNAGQAIVALKRDDLLPALVDVLEEPDPRLLFVKEMEGVKVWMVREVVRLNHHHNCMLCHAPAENIKERFPSMITGAVPSPSQLLPPEVVYYSMPFPETLIRADITYLRQDFSLMLPVADHEPWPALQRFDFLVRTRRLNAAEVKEYETWKAREGNELSPYQQAALFALRTLTGREEPSAPAWRRSLGMK